MSYPIQRVLLVGALLAAGACSTEPAVDIGRSEASLVDFAAHWDGYVEAYEFDDMTDRVRITLDGTGAGTFQIGDAPLFPAATDFTKGYPVNETMKSTDLQGNRLLRGRLRPGFQYPIHDARIEEGRLRFFVDPSDPFDVWCRAQTPIAIPGGGNPPWDDYQCVSSTMGLLGPGPTPESCAFNDGSGGTEVATVIDCAKYNLCTDYTACTCSASGCTAAHRDYGRQQFDASLDMPRKNMVGTLLLKSPEPTATPERLTLKLTR